MTDALGKFDKARKSIAAWGITADELKALSEKTGKSQIELLYNAVRDLAARVREREMTEMERDATDDEEGTDHA
jgi:glutamyl-tRNA reductase